MCKPEEYQEFYEEKRKEFFKVCFENKDLNNAVFDTYRAVIIEIITTLNRMAITRDCFEEVMYNKAMYNQLSNDNKEKIIHYTALLDTIISEHTEIVEIIAEM